MTDFLLSLDRSLLLLINGAHCDYADQLFYWVSNRFIWIPYYAVLLFFLANKYGKTTWKILPFVVLLILATDQGANLLKFSVQRFRPCHEPSLQGMLHLVNGYCGGDYGFVSSHASNSMGLMVFLLLLLPDAPKAVRFSLPVYVLLLAYSRIYLAAHYPGDVLGGWVIGISMGWLTASLIKKKI